MYEVAGITMKRSSLPFGLGVLLAGSTPAMGQFFITGAGLGYSASQSQGPGLPSQSLWQLQMTERYNAQAIQSSLRELTIGGLIYANDHDEHLPNLASELFAGGYVSDPRTFHNPGDVDPPPVTINNDVLDAPNSARISFDYFGAGHTTSDPNLLVFADNTAANNMGLGRFAVYADSHAVFLPESPRVFQPISEILRDGSPTTIWRNGDPQFVPHTVPFPPGCAAQAVVAPHQFHFSASSEINSAVHAVYEAEGYGSFNFVGIGPSIVLSLSPEFTGADATQQLPLTVYMSFSTTMSREPSTAMDSVQISASWQSSVFDLPNAIQETSYVVWTGIGLFWLGHVVLVEERLLGPGDPGYVAGMESVRVRGVMPLTITVPRDALQSMALFTRLSLSTPIDPSSTGLAKQGVVDMRVPVTLALDRLIVYGPPGLNMVLTSSSGPADLIQIVGRGDADYDGDVDVADRSAFQLAYSHPLVSIAHVEPAFESLHPFDFDGDADVDCADWQRFTEVWTGGGEPAVIAACAMDGDADGIPDGDDDCPGSLPGSSADERGCPMGDVDADADVDLDDWSLLVQCIPSAALPFPLPPAGYLTAHCYNSLDDDGDHTFELADFAAFFNRFTGSTP